MTTGPLGYPSDPQARAQQLVKEGRIGGVRPGSGRPRKPRASELASEAAERHWAAIEEALLAGVESGTPEQRARTAARWIGLAQVEDGHDLRARKDSREADAFDLMTADQIVAEGTDLFLGLLRTGRVDLDQLRAQLDEPAPVDAVVIDAD